MNTLNIQSIKLKDIILNKQEKHLLHNIIDLFKKTIKNVSDTSQTSKIFKKINKLINININIDQQISYIKQSKKEDDLKKIIYLQKKIEHNKQEILNLLRQLEINNISSSKCDNTKLQEFIDDINSNLKTNLTLNDIKIQFIDYYRKVDNIFKEVKEMTSKVSDMILMSDNILNLIKQRNS
jgi:hypothetical protein